MNLTPPRPELFYIAVGLAILAAIGKVVAIPVVSAYAFGILLLAFIVLVFGVLVRNW